MRTFKGMALAALVGIGLGCGGSPVDDEVLSLPVHDGKTDGVTFFDLKFNLADPQHTAVPGSVQGQTELN